MNMDWKECKYTGLIKEVKPDKDLINSLISSSKNTLETCKRINFDEITASPKIVLTYSSLRELLEAIAIKKGFKIYNHECFYSFLKEVCKNNSLAIEFNRFRILRNQISYYGKKVSLEESKNIVNGIFSLISKIKKEIL